jgi:signal transduction histidine kinase
MGRGVMKGLRNILPIGLITAIILPGITISILGIHFLSQQKSVREMAMREMFQKELRQIGDSLETRILDLVNNALTQFPGRDQFRKKGDMLAGLKQLLLENGIVKYPFIINHEGEFIFPIVQKSPRQFLKAYDHAAKDGRIKRLYQMAADLELNHKRYMEALLIYDQCFHLTPSSRSLPFLFNAIARCYFKMEKVHQALYYYHLILNQFEDSLAENAPLKILILRQLAKCYQLQGIIPRASSFYLVLYEEILKYETLVRGEDFLFLKNEALNFLNQYARKSTIDPSGSNTRELPTQLKTQSEVDITLQWLFLEGEASNPLVNNQSSSRGQQLLKIEELYASTDEKTRFYQMINKLPLTSTRPDPRPPILQLSDWRGQTREICFRKIPSSAGITEDDIYIGFLISHAYIKESLYPDAVERAFKHPSLKLALIERGASQTTSPWPDHPYHLLTHTFQQFLASHGLSVFAARDHFFSRQVKREIWINYGLVSVLIVILILSSVLFLRYIQRESEVVRLKSDFIDHASHTLKTPLTRMALLAENIAQGWAEGKEQKAYFAKAILEETSHINQLVNNLLNFSRIEAGKMEYQFRRCYLQEVMERFLHQYTPMIKREGFQLDVLMDENLPPASIDPDAITLVILNVCQNAIKYSPKERWIRFDLRRQENWLNLSISDHGIGIGFKDQHRVFDKFYRGHDATAKAQEGSGLGLFLVREIVSAHNGKVQLESEPDGGSTFSILLPIFTKEDEKDDQDFNH